MPNDKNENLKIEFEVKLPKEEAFSTFVNQLERWWPKEYTWSGEALEAIKIEPKANGKCYETGPYNFRCDWGRVITFKPSGKLIFTWQISPARTPEPDPEKASEVCIQFRKGHNSSTLIDFEHRNFSRHGEGWHEYLKAMKSQQGWPYILNKFKSYCTTPNE